MGNTPLTQKPADTYPRPRTAIFILDRLEIGVKRDRLRAWTGVTLPWVRNGEWPSHRDRAVQEVSNAGHVGFAMTGAEKLTSEPA